MCNTKVFQHGCGHSSSRYLSCCRGTYSDPKGSNVLCHSSPSLTVTVSVPCSTCLYKKFRDEWEKKLSNAQEKHFVASQMMYEFQNDGASCGELDDGLLGSGEGMSDFFGDAETANRERQRAEDELRRLKEEYERESARQWKSFMSGEGQVAKRKATRLRRPSMKCAGSSPLKNVKASDDVSTEGSEDDDQSSDTDMSRTPSLVSDTDAGSPLDPSEVCELPSPSALPPSNWTLPDVMWEKTSSPVQTRAAPLGTPLIEEDSDDMLPNYGF